MDADAVWAEAVVAQACRELSELMNEFGQRGLDRAAEWLTAERMQEVRRRLSSVEPVLSGSRNWPDAVRSRLLEYRQRLEELQSLLVEMQGVLRRQVVVYDDRREQVMKLALWLAAYRETL